MTVIYFFSRCFSSASKISRLTIVLLFAINLIKWFLTVLCASVRGFRMLLKYHKELMDEMSIQLRKQWKEDFSTIE